MKTLKDLKPWDYIYIDLVWQTRTIVTENNGSVLCLLVDGHIDTIQDYKSVEKMNWSYGWTTKKTFFWTKYYPVNN